MPRRRPSTSGKTGGLSTKAFGGLNKKNYESKAGTFGQKIRFEEGKRVTVQFAGDPSDEDCFKEFYQHSWKEGNKWNFVPCTDDECPLCEEEDGEIRKKGYRFIAKVWSHSEKKMQILEGPKDLAGRIVYQWERNKSKFKSKVWDVLPMATTPRTYQVDFNEDVIAKRTLVDDEKNPIDLDEYLETSLKAYYGEDGLVNSGKSSLDDDDDVDEDDEDDEEAPTPPRRKRESATRTTRRTRRR